MQNHYKNGNSEDAREAWLLRAGAELWKAVVAEAGSPAKDTEEALLAVRLALDCARRLRCAGQIGDQEKAVLALEAARAVDVQAEALQKWGRGRGLRWGKEWGMEWGESLSQSGPAPRTNDAETSAQA